MGSHQKQGWNGIIVRDKVRGREERGAKNNSIPLQDNWSQDFGCLPSHSVVVLEERLSSPAGSILLDWDLFLCTFQEIHSLLAEG